MKYIRNHTFLAGILFLTVMSLALFCIGGEYLHSHIHHQDGHTVDEQCPIYKLQAQAFTLISTVYAALFALVVLVDIADYAAVAVLQPNYILPDSHAPPSFLF